MDVRAQLTIKNKKTGEKQSYRLDQDKVSMGRDQSNYVVLDGKTVSRRHAELSQEGNQFFLRDLKSNNGTILNDLKIRPQEKALLRSGDVIQIEEYEIQFHIPISDSRAKTESSEDFYEITDTDLLEVKMVKKLLKAMDRESAPSFEVIEGPQAGLRFVLEGKNQDITIGRDPACEFVIDSDVISRKHARVEKRFDSVVLYDLKSRNGLFVNRERIQEQQLRDGDIIHLGTLALSFRNPQELTFDLEPPHIEEAKSEVQTAEKKHDATQEDSIEHASPQQKAKPTLALPEARVSQSRKKSKKEKFKEKFKKKSKEENRLPAEVASETPSADQFGEQSNEQENHQTNQPSNESLPEEPLNEDPGLSLGGLKLSPVEIIAIAMGAVVLIGSIWGIIKLLG